MNEVDGFGEGESAAAGGFLVGGVALDDPLITQPLKELNTLRKGWRWPKQRRKTGKRKAVTTSSLLSGRARQRQDRQVAAAAWCGEGGFGRDLFLTTTLSSVCWGSFLEEERQHPGSNLGGGEKPANHRNSLCKKGSQEVVESPPPLKKCYQAM